MLYHDGGRKEKEEEKREENGSPFLYSHIPGTFPKWMALRSCLFLPQALRQGHYV